MRIRITVLRKLIREELEENALAGGAVTFGPPVEEGDEELDESKVNSEHVIDFILGAEKMFYVSEAAAEKFRTPYNPAFYDAYGKFFIDEITANNGTATVESVKKAVRILKEISGLNPSEMEEFDELVGTPEYLTLETFIDYKMSDMESPDDKPTFTHIDVAALAHNLEAPVSAVIKTLKDYGMVQKPREVAKRTRGFTTSSNDRWYGPGSQATHGGAGIDSSSGRATVRGKTI